MPLTKSTVAAIDQRVKDDPDFAAAVEAELLGDARSNGNSLPFATPADCLNDSSPQNSALSSQ